MVASQAPLTRDLACNPGMCPNWESNQQPSDSQMSTQSTEAHQPGQEKFLTDFIVEEGDMHPLAEEKVEMKRLKMEEIEVIFDEERF